MCCCWLKSLINTDALCVWSLASIKWALSWKYRNSIYTQSHTHITRKHSGYARLVTMPTSLWPATLTQFQLNEYWWTTSFNDFLKKSTIKCGDWKEVLKPETCWLSTKGSPQDRDFFHFAQNAKKLSCLSCRTGTLEYDAVISCLTVRMVLPECWAVFDFSVWWDLGFGLIRPQFSSKSFQVTTQPQANLRCDFYWLFSSGFPPATLPNKFNLWSAIKVAYDWMFFPISAKYLKNFFSWLLLLVTW